MDIKLTFVCVDFWGNPVYKTNKGRIIADLSPESSAPSLYTMTGNEVDGEPDRCLTVKAGNRLVFIQKRYAM